MAVYFKELWDNLCVQMGQKDFIEVGLKRSLPYQTFFRNYLESKDFFKEFVSIFFFESSFNFKVYFRVSVFGVW